MLSTDGLGRRTVLRKSTQYSSGSFGDTLQRRHGAEAAEKGSGLLQSRSSDPGQNPVDERCRGRLSAKQIPLILQKARTQICLEESTACRR